MKKILAFFIDFLFFSLLLINNHHGNQKELCLPLKQKYFLSPGRYSFVLFQLSEFNTFSIVVLTVVKTNADY